MVEHINPEVLAIIQARGGSKSIPRKNIRKLGGFPLISYSIIAAKEASLVSRVIVSTDDPEIAEVSREWGAEVPFLRPPELATDDAVDYLLFEHALNWLKEHERYKPDIIVQLRPTSPFRPKGLIDEGVRKLLSNPKADSVRAVTIPKQNPYKMWKIEGEYMKPLISNGFREPFNMPRQKLPAVYWQTGHLDVIRYRTIANKHSLTGDFIMPIFVDPIYSIDIDTELDWEQAEWILSNTQLDIVSPAPETKLPLYIQLLVLDFDGVLTDNRVWTSESGEEMVVSNRGDGMGLNLLRKSGINVMVLSTEENPVVAKRCEKLQIEYYQGISDKAQFLNNFLKSNNIKKENVVYVGNDINDLECIEMVGCGVAVADAHPVILKNASLILKHPGGRGAVREICEMIMNRTKKDQKWPNRR